MLHDFLTRAAHRCADATAITAGPTQLSYGELAEAAAALAGTLREAAGVRPGDRVVVGCSEPLEAAIAFWAAAQAMAVVVMVSPRTPAAKRAWLIEDAQATVVIADELAVSVVAAGSPAGGAPPIPAPDLAALVYTSGSSGDPKAVMVTHANVDAAAESISGYLGLSADDVILNALPLSFDYGLYQLIMSAHVGARVVLERGFELPGQVLNTVVRERVTVLPGVPTMFALLAKLPSLARWDLSGVRTITSTAAALGPEQIAWLTRTFPAAEIFSMYGLTECKRCTYLPPADLARKPTSVGIAIPGNTLWVVDEQDRVLGPGEVGELVINGPTVTAGYWRRPEETARRFRPGPDPGTPVLYTGDLCRLDDEGYLSFVARMDDVIKSRGEKVAPAEVERALRSIPGVLEAAVVGRSHDVLGEAIHAFVVLDNDSAATPASLRRDCRAQLEPFMIPHTIELVDVMPRSANGKIEKAALV